MDIKKEISEIISDNNSVNTVIDKILEEKEQLDKKIHIFKVIDLGNKIEKAIESGLFKKPKVVSINLCLAYQNSEYFETLFSVENNDGDSISLYDNRLYYEKTINFFEEIFIQMGTFRTAFTNGETEHNKIKLTKGIKEKILNVFLSEELRKIYDYNLMDLELDNSNEKNNKRLKI